MRSATTIIGGFIVAVSAACGGDAVGPVSPEPMYQLSSANGERVPVHSFQIVSNSAGSCAYDLAGGSLSFSSNNRYTFGISFLARCSGNPTPMVVHESSEGTYSRSGNDLVLTPRLQGSWTPTRIVLRSNEALVMIPASGEVHQLQFTAL